MRLFVWVVLVLFCFLLLIFHCVLLVRFYNNNNKTTAMSLASVQFA